MTERLFYTANQYSEMMHKPNQGEFKLIGYAIEPLSVTNADQRVSLNSSTIESTENLYRIYVLFDIGKYQGFTTLKNVKDLSPSTYANLMAKTKAQFLTSEVKLMTSFLK